MYSDEILQRSRTTYPFAARRLADACDFLERNDTRTRSAIAALVTVQQYCINQKGPHKFKTVCCYNLKSGTKTAPQSLHRGYDLRRIVSSSPVSHTPFMGLGDISIHHGERTNRGQTEV